MGEDRFQNGEKTGEAGTRKKILFEEVRKENSTKSKRRGFRP